MQTRLSGHHPVTASLRWDLSFPSNCIFSFELSIDMINAQLSELNHYLIKELNVQIIRGGLITIPVKMSELFSFRYFYASIKIEEAQIFVLSQSCLANYLRKLPKLSWQKCQDKSWRMIVQSTATGKYFKAFTKFLSDHTIQLLASFCSHLV